MASPRKTRSMHQLDGVASVDQSTPSIQNAPSDSIDLASLASGDQSSSHHLRAQSEESEGPPDLTLAESETNTDDEEIKETTEQQRKTRSSKEFVPAPPKLKIEGSIKTATPSTVSRSARKRTPKAKVPIALTAPVKNSQARKKPGPKPKKEKMKMKKKRTEREESEESDEGDEQAHRQQLEFTYTVPLRQPNGKKKCFMCSDVTCTKTSAKNSNEKEKEKTSEEFVTCGITGCGQQMHLSCVDTFICAEYTPRNAALLFCVKNPVCPAHFCWHCYDERQKNSSRFGTLVDCTDCMRSFHKQCVPAGALIHEHNGKRSTTTCFMHVSAEDSPTIHDAHRLKYCTECEQLLKGNKQNVDEGERKMNCAGCTNVFHRKCSFRRVKGTIMGQAYENNYCVYCVQSTVIVPNQYVFAYWHQSTTNLPKGNYPGQAMAIGDLPEHIRKKLGSRLTMIGWIPIKWLWNEATNPFYNMIHKSRVQRMFLGCEKNLPDNLFKDEVDKASLEFFAPTVPLDIKAQRATIKRINGNVFFPGVQRMLYKNQHVSCTCKPAPGSKIKCETSDCLNRAVHMECWKDCDDEANGITCANRSMQKKKEKEEKVKYEVKEAPGKGYGVFATAPIKACEFLMEYGGEVIDDEERLKREKRVLDLRSNDEYTYMMGLTKRIFVDARFMGTDARFVNHCCEPNSVVNSVDIPIQYFKSTEEVQCEPKIKVTALRDIAAGEEITFSYQLTKSKGLAVDHCKCGAKTCKGKIGDKKSKNDTDDDRVDRTMPLTAADDYRIGRMEGSEEKENSPKKRQSASKKTPKKIKKEEPRSIGKSGVQKRRGSYSAGTPKRGRDAVEK